MLKRLLSFRLTKDVFCCKHIRLHFCIFVFSCFFYAIIVPNLNAQDLNEGEKIFKATCATCHTIGKGRLTGPDLKDVSSRVPSEEWMVPWIRSSAAVIKSGDEYANKIYKENNEVKMTDNPLTDEEIWSVIAYMKEESTKVPVKEAAAGPNPYELGNEIPKDNSETDGLITIVIIFLVLAFVLSSIKLSLKRINAEVRGGEDPAEKSVLDGIKIWMAGNKRIVALCILIMVAFLSRAGWNNLLYINIEQGYEPEQPIWFSHKIHAGENGINCVYCHSGAEKSKTAGIPSANVCMNCHKAIKEGTLTGDKEIPKIYAALDYDPETQEYGNDPKPIRWVKIHNLPDLAYFNHSQHVVVGEIECQKCHGPVEEMHVMRQESMLTMGWCIDCHRDTEVKMEGNPYYTELHEKLKEKYKGQKITVDKMGGLDCARCHY